MSSGEIDDRNMNMEKNNILISVIIPVYNVADYLSECLESVISQTFKEIEIICINDASPDKSGEILESYGKIDKRIKLIKNKNNIGYQASRNEGMEIASGKYIYFMDSDDYLKSPDALELLYGCMERDYLDAVCFGAKTVDELVDFHRSSFFDGRKRNEYPSVMTGEESYWELLKNGEYKSPVWMYLYRRDFLIRIEIRFIEHSCSEDMPFTFHVHFLAKRVGVLCENLYCYRLRDNSQVHSDRRVFKTKSLERNVRYLLNLVSKVKMDGNRKDKMLAHELRIEIDAWRNRFENCTYDEKVEYIDSVDDEIMKALFVKELMDNLPYMIPENIINDLKEHPVFLYGAGDYARRYIRLLDKYEIEISGIYVTKKERDSLYGYRITEYSNKAADRDLIIILSVSDRYKAEIKENLNNGKMERIIDMEDFRI